MGAEGRRWVAPSATAAAIGLFIVHHLNLYVTVAGRHTFEDQTVLWDIARDLRNGELHQLDFPGQFYGSSLEALPAAILGGMGLSDHRAFSVTLLGLTLGSWVALAIGIHRRGHPWLARAALLVPVALTVDYSASALMWATAAPRAMAIAAVGVALGARRPSTRWITLVAVGGTAILFDTSTALLVVPTLAWAAVADRGAIPGRAIVTAAAAPVAIAVGRAVHHAANPAYDLHPAPSASPGWAPAEWHLRNPTRTLRSYGPEMLVSPTARSIAVAVALVAIAVFVARRGALPARAALGAAVVGLVVFYTNEGSLRSAEFTTTMLSVGRGLMSLPVLAVVLVTVVADRFPPRIGPPAFLAVVAVALAGFVVRVVDDSPGAFVDEISATPAIDAWPLDDVATVCRTARAQLDLTPGSIALATSATLAGACSADLDETTVLFPRYERRTWDLARTWSTAQTEWLVLGRGAQGCAPVPVEYGCRVVDTDVTLVTTPQMTPPEAVHALGLGMRRLPGGFPDA